MGEHDRVELTEQLYEVLKRVAHTLSHGQSLSILTRDEEVSTQQAAEILGLSRPTVVRLIQDGELHAHAPGAVRRKLRLAIARAVVGCSRSLGAVDRGGGSVTPVDQGVQLLDLRAAWWRPEKVLLSAF